jgi:hypothetical protein
MNVQNICEPEHTGVRVKIIITNENVRRFNKTSGHLQYR